MHGPWHMPEHPDEADIPDQEEEDMTTLLEAHIDHDLPVPPDPRFPYRVWLEAIPATSRPGDFPLAGAWYGRPPGLVGMDNQAIYWRTSQPHATWMDRASAILTVQDFRASGYPCRCDPPITVTVTY